MKGMGSYTKVEKELSHYSADEMNELFLSGGLDKIYENFERENESVLTYGAGVVISDEELEAIIDREEDEEFEEEFEEGGYPVETIQQ